MSGAESSSSSEMAATTGNAAETDSRSKTFGRTDAFVVRQPITAGKTDTVRALVGGRHPATADGTGWILSGPDVATVSLFLERGGSTDALVWYVEVTDGAWADPVQELLGRSPLFDAGLSEHLDDAVRGVDAAEQVVHAHNPARPGTPDGCDVVMVRLGIRPGPGSWIARLLARAINLLEGTWVQRKFEDSSADVIEDERMWTETLWLERSGSSYAVRWYMEADEMDYVMEAYEASDNRVARWSNDVLNRVFEEPIEALGDPRDVGDWELLAHATDPERP